MEKLKLFPHQKQALKTTEDRNRVAYYLDMGLGKTFVGSEKMVALGNRINLLVCQKSKIKDWKEHFQIYYQMQVLDLTITKELSEFMGMFASQRHCVVGIINYELAWRRSEDLKNLHKFTLMLDESSLIQNPSAKQSKFIVSMNPDNVILLSGTPTGGKYENLWTQLHLLGWDISEKVYDTHYVNYKKIEAGGFVHKIVDKDDPYKNVERLKAKMREHGAVFMKTDEVFDLPDQTFQIIKHKTSKEYRKFMKEHLVTVDGTEFVGDSIFSFRLSQRMLCSVYNTERIEAFRNLVESTQDRLIVFYNFNCELMELEACANDLERPYSLVNGQVKDLQAYETESNSLTFVQYKAGAMGLNLQKANKIIYFSLTEESELFEQSKKRIHRIGQGRPCFYYIMVCENSIEDKEILPTLNIRKEYTDELFQDTRN